MSPVIPHFASECLEMLIKKGFNEKILWPKINKNILKSDKINFIVQINGKTRGILNVAINLSEKELINKIREADKLNNYIKDKKIKNKIFINNKLINIIV